VRPDCDLDAEGPVVGGTEAEVGAAFDQAHTGLKPAGRGEGPVISTAEQAIRQAMLGLQVWAHKLYLAATSGQHHSS